MSVSAEAYKIICEITHTLTYSIHFYSFLCDSIIRAQLYRRSGTLRRINDINDATFSLRSKILFRSR